MSFYPVAPLPNYNSRQLATPIRMPSTSLLTIDSEDRYNNYADARQNLISPYNFSISKSENIMPGFITRLGISEVVFPWSIPNINLKTNKINFVYNSGAGEVSTTLVLNIGFYNPDRLQSFLETTIQTLVPTFQMQYGVAQQTIFTYASGTPGTTVGFRPMDPNTATYPFSENAKQLFDLLGFTSANEFLTNTTFAGINTFCQATRYVDIVCNQLTNSASLKDQTSQPISRDMLCRLYLGDLNGTQNLGVFPNDVDYAPPGTTPGVIYRNFTTPKQIQWQPNQNIPGFLTFQVYDDEGDLLDASVTTAFNQFGYMNWSMTMLVSEN